MNGEAVTDLILRAIAAMRERGDLPEVETPRITVTAVSGVNAETFRSNVGQALAAAQTGEHPLMSPHTLATTIADYLSEVVDLVPAYHDVASVRALDDGTLIITLRSSTNP